jgi:hypothetical protein
MLAVGNFLRDNRGSDAIRGTGFAIQNALGVTLSKPITHIQALTK